MESAEGNRLFSTASLLAAKMKLGVGPGSVLEWDEQGSEVVVRRAGRHSSEAIHLALFPAKTPKKDLSDVKDSIRKYIRKRHARR